MKKLTLVAIALLASVVSFALNPFAYGLSSSLSDDGINLTVNYSLNANATSVNVVILNGEDVVATLPSDGTTKGDHSMRVSAIDLPKNVSLTWKVEVNGNSVDKPTQEPTAYNLYCPHGLAIDKDPESEYFGRILVADAMQIVKDKTGYLGSGKGAGLYVFAPDFTNDGKVYNGGLDFTRKLASNGYQPYRVKISEDGRIFVSSLDLNGVVVWEVSKDLQTWTPVIAGTNNATDYNIYDAESNFVAGLNCSMDVIGSGENLKLLLYSTNNKGIAYNQSGYRLDEYALGTATTWTGTPKNILTGGKYALVHTNAEFIYDGEGGYWFGASRGGNAGQPNLAHINAEGVEDYRDETNTYYGGDGVLLHKGMLIKGRQTTVDFITLGKDAEGKPTLTSKWNITADKIGRNKNEFAVDYADNLYVVGNSGEKIIAYALPYSGKVSTPAAAKYAFELQEVQATVYTIIATPNNDAMGTVSGAGTYVEGDEVTLTATPKTGHIFVDWSNGETTNPLVFNATEDVELTANFKALQYTVTVGVNDEAKGSVTHAGANTLDYGTKLVLEATPAEGNRFVQWSTGATDNPLTITVTKDLEIAALFENTNITARAWAYDLSLTTEGDNYTFTFKATTPATATLIFTNADGEETGLVELGTIAAGVNTKTLTAAEIPGEGKLNWAVKMAYDEVVELREVTDQSRGIYNFYSMMDVLVDNNPESEYFGKIYIQQSMDGVSDGATTRSQTQKSGIFIYDQELNELNPTSNVGIQPTLPAGYSIGTGRNTFHRLDIDPKTGNLTYCYNIAGQPAVFAMDRANLTGEITNLVADIDGISRTSAHCFDAEGALYVYDLPAAATIYKIVDGVATVFAASDAKWVQASATMAVDGRGGLWVAQNRGQMDSYYQLAHYTKDGVLDYAVYEGNTNGFTGGSVRGALAYDAERHILAQGRNGAVELFNVAYDAETGVPTLTKFATTPAIATNIDGLHFDYAGDLYVVNSSTEKFQKFVIPTDNNTCTTPAASKYAFEIATVVEPVEMVGVVKRALQNGEGVVVLTHEADGTPHIYNMVGETITEVSQEGVVPVNPANEYDYLSISDIALTDDGKLVACNYIRCAAADPSVGTTRYYIWNDLAEAPALWFTSYKTGNSTLGDVGYTFAVKGVSTNAQVMTTAVHNKNRAARINLHTIVNGVEETSKYHRFGLHTTDSYFTEAKRGVQFQLSTTPLDGTWAMDGDLANPAGFTVPSDVNAGYVGTELPAEVVLGKKYNGASYVTCLLKELMVAPYADAEEKLAGVKVIDITAGFATAKVIKEANLDAPVAATAAATAVAVAENVLTVTLVADAEVHTLTIELDTKPDTHTITATANIEERGYIEGLENEGVYEAGDEVTLRAVANDGYEFVDWSNGSTDNPLTFVVKKDENLVANFRPVLASSITLNALPVHDYSTSIVGTIKRAIQNGENTIVLTHEADGTPHIYNVAHATKTVTEISQEGVVARDPDNVGDYLSISDIALTDDGKLVACNYIRCQNTDAQVDAGYKRGTNRFYIWDELTGAAKEWFTEQFAGNSYRADAGYTMALKGSSTDCNVLVTVRHYNAAGAGGSDGSVRMHYFTIAGGAKTSRIYLGWTIEPTAPYYTHTIGENMLLSSSPIATMNFIMDANLTVPSEFQVIGDAKDVTILGRMAADSVSAKYNGASCLPNYNEHHLLLTPYANEEGNLAGVKVLDIADGLTGATELITNTDLATAENSTAAAATAVVDAEGKLTIHLFADAKVYTFTQKEQGPATAIDNNTAVAPQVDKILRNGLVLIIRDGKTYNMVGQEVK